MKGIEFKFTLRTAKDFDNFKSLINDDDYDNIMT